MPVVLNMERCSVCGKFFKLWEPFSHVGCCPKCASKRVDRQLAASFRSLDLIKKAAADNGIQLR